MQEFRSSGVGGFSHLLQEVKLGTALIMLMKSTQREHIDAMAGIQAVLLAVGLGNAWLMVSS